MRMLNKRTGLVACLAAATVMSLAVAGPASADTAARNGDAVGVGSDTLQNALDFVLDGAPGVAGGYNNVGNKNRIVNVFATGDANGRATYDGTCGTAGTNGIGAICGAAGLGTAVAPNLLKGDVILRTGTNPVVRPNGSGAGVAALDADGTTGYETLPTGSIQYARMSRLPTSTEETNCSGTCGGLDVYSIATDVLGLAHVTTGYNGPALISAQELYAIFVGCTITTWNQLTGNSAGSTDTIHPLIPQSGSGTRNFFLADLYAAAGVSGTQNPGPCDRVVEEHDPTGIYGDPTPGDAIEPFSQAKLGLINGTNTGLTGAYFVNPGYSGTGEANGAYTPNYLTIQGSGTAGDGNAAYTSGAHEVYVVLKAADVASATAFQPGGSQNFSAVFLAQFTSASGKAELKAAGFTPDFISCGNNPATC